MYRMNKFKVAALPLLFLCASFIILFLGFEKLELVPSLDIDSLIGLEEVNKNTSNNSQLIEELKNTYLSNDDNFTVPKKLNGFWLNINKDIDATSQNTTEEVKYEIYSDFDYYRNFVPNSVFIRPDTENEFSHLLEPDGTAFDILAYTLYYSGTLDLCNILVIDDSIIYDENGKFTSDKLYSYLSEYNFDGVLLSADSLYGINEYYTAVEFFSNYIRSNFQNVFFGCEIHTDFEKMFADDYVIKVFENRLVDFGYVDCKSPTAALDYSFSTIAFWWNSFADYYQIPFYCEHRADLIFTDDSLWGLSTEINSQLKVLYNCSAFKGSCFYRAKYLKSNKALARDLSILLNDVTSSSQDTFSVDSLEINNNRIYFTGTANSDYTNIFCNDKRIVQKDGFFEKSYIMTPGLNVFDFFSNYGEYVYNVYNNSPLIDTCFPDNNITAENNSVINAYTVCPVDSRVFAVFNGNTYEMSVSQSVSASSVPEGYCVYTCDITVGEKYHKGTELSYLCLYGDMSYDVTPCKVYSGEIKDSDGINPVNSVLSPYVDNGLGTSLMCMINADNTEQISDKDDYNTYHPYKSSLLKGTIDYIERINVSNEGYLRYELKSGINVYGADCILINNGYNLPLNKVVLKSYDDINADKSILRFSMDWLSPVTVTVKNPEYKIGYDNYNFNIDSFNSSAIDISFYHSAFADTSVGMVFDEKSVFSNYEVIHAENNTVILRLHLKEAGIFYGYDLIESENGNIEITFKKRESNNVAGKVVLLDPGHGGISMVGTAINDNSVSEAQVTLAIAMKAKYYLEQLGAKVIMTRVMDSSLSLYERTEICEKEDPDIFVSIHCDGVDNIAESGTHTFYYTAYSQPLAQHIHNAMVSAYLNNIYVEADDNYSRVDRKIKYYPFYVTRVDNCPSVLIECGFMSNYVEGYVLANPVNQDYLGHAIADGIVDYFSDN